MSYQVSERRACGVLDFSRSTHRYLSVADAHEELRIRLRDLAATRPNWGYRRLGLLLQREGWHPASAGTSWCIGSTVMRAWGCGAGAPGAA